jgi:hypothetical protein
MVARATKGSAVRPTSRRARSTRDMSASIHVVHVAAVSSERFMWSPTSLRMRESGAAAGGW